MRKYDALCGKWRDVHGPIVEPSFGGEQNNKPHDPDNPAHRTCADMAPVLRAALIRLLWRSIADGDERCYGNDSAPDPCDDGDPAELDVCQAMRALGWGRHWDPEVFQRNAMEMGGNAV